MLPLFVYLPLSLTAPLPPPNLSTLTPASEGPTQGQSGQDLSFHKTSSADLSNSPLSSARAQEGSEHQLSQPFSVLRSSQLCHGEEIGEEVKGVEEAMAAFSSEFHLFVNDVLTGRETKGRKCRLAELELQLLLLGEERSREQETRFLKELIYGLRRSFLDVRGWIAFSACVFKGQMEVLEALLTIPVSPIALTERRDSLLASSVAALWLVASKHFSSNMKEEVGPLLRNALEHIDPPAPGLASSLPESGWSQYLPSVSSLFQSAEEEQGNEEILASEALQELQTNRGPLLEELRAARERMESMEVEMDAEEQELLQQLKEVEAALTNLQEERKTWKVSGIFRL